MESLLFCLENSYGFGYCFFQERPTDLTDESCRLAEYGIALTDYEEGRQGNGKDVIL
jgi:hypothetical protein